MGGGLDTSKSIEFLKSVDRIADADLSDSIIRFAFEFFENNFISPNWWDGLSFENKEAIIKRMNYSVDFTERTSDILKYDGYKYSNWHILRRYKNF